MGNLNETNTKKFEDGTIADKGTEDPPRTNYRKRKMLELEKENSDTWTVRVKKSRVSVRILIKSLILRSS